LRVVSENRQCLLDLRDRVRREIEGENLIATDGSSIFINPKFNYYRDILGMLIQAEGKERHDE
jgi:hypothetical protein